jgi:hypothetical protein
MTTQHGMWVSYSGSAEIVLAAVLTAAAAGVAYGGLRLPLPARLPRPGRTTTVCLVLAWVVAIVAFVACLALYIEHALREHLGGHATPADPITPVSVVAFGIVWFAIALMHNSRGWRVALGSALIGALAGPMIFELPFDLIVMARTYPAMPPDPAAYRILFFAPLFAVEIVTLALLTTSPVVRLTRATFWCFAGMLAVFAGWAVVGFAYPSAPAPFALNVVSKVLAFLAALSMFLPERSQPGTAELEPAPQEAWTSVM